MAPILFSIGPITIFNFSICVIIAWVLYSFIFWQRLRNNGVEDEKIFDITFYSTIAALLISRLFYVLLHLQLFIPNLLKIVAFWVLPGFSLIGVIIGIGATCVFMAKKHKIRLSYLFDALGLALPISLIFGSIGSFLDGTIAGKISHIPFAVSYIGYSGRRHPIQLYDIVSFVIIIGILIVIEKISIKKKWTYGLVGIWFFLLFGISQFVLEFFKESNIYWGSLSLNQWTYVALISESFGALYIKIGGRQKILYQLASSKVYFQKKLKEIYDKFPKRANGRNSKTS
jgi:phosphatidylglycerol---prolipoprotein diacylglyceryl transferase